MGRWYHLALLRATPPFSKSLVVSSRCAVFVPSIAFGMRPLSHRPRPFPGMSGLQGVSRVDSQVTAQIMRGLGSFRTWVKPPLSHPFQDIFVITAFIRGLYADSIVWANSLIPSIWCPQAGGRLRLYPVAGLHYPADQLHYLELFFWRYVFSKHVTFLHRFVYHKDTQSLASRTHSPLVPWSVATRLRILRISKHSSPILPINWSRF